METAILIIGGVLVVGFIIVRINKPFWEQLKIKFRGRTDEVMRQDAMTPEGAADYYNNAIREKEERYLKSNQLYTEVTGKLETAKKELRQMQKEQMQKNQNMQQAIDNENDNDAMTFALRLETLKSNIDVAKQAIRDLEETVSHQKEVRDQLAIEVQSLKEEKDKTLFQLQAANQQIQLHEAIDDIASSNESDRMLEHVREGVTKAQERATGSRIAYESSMATQERRAEQRAREDAARQLVEDAKRKRG